MNKGLVACFISIGLIGVTAGVCFGVPQVRNQIVGIYHDVENKVNDTDLKNQIADLQLKLDDLTDKYNVNLDSFNKLKSEKENLLNEIEEIKANNELTIVEKNKLINSLNFQIEEKNVKIENLTSENSNYLLEIAKLEEDITSLNNQLGNIHHQYSDSSVFIDGIDTVFPVSNIIDYLESIYIKSTLNINGLSYDNVGFKRDLTSNNAVYLGYYDVNKSFVKIGKISNDTGSKFENVTYFWGRVHFPNYIDTVTSQYLIFNPDIELEDGSKVSMPFWLYFVDNEINDASFSINNIGNVVDL